MTAYLPCLLMVLALLVPRAYAQSDPLAQVNSLTQEAYSLYREGHYREAIPKAREVLTLREQALGPTHPDVATSLNNLAMLLRLTGDYAAARPLYERALHIEEQALGPTHPHVAAGLDNLAGLLQRTRDYAEAETLYRRALAIREASFGPTHPDVATSLNNLAMLLRLTGDYAAARPLYERALHIREQALGPTHPDVATSLNNLARFLQATGDYTAARPLYERALRINEQALGAAHPDVAVILNNLGNLREATGDYAAARPLYERALTIKEQALGPTHPDVAVSLNNLAGLLRATGDYAAARPLYERALRITEAALGSTNADVAITLNNLAEILRITGDYAAARPLYERALKIYEQALGPSHRLVGTSLNNLALLLQATGDYAAARPLYERALTINEQALGPTHPDVALSLNNLANLLQATGDYAAARPLYERGLHLREQALGPTHPDVAVSLENLARADWETGRLEKAVANLTRAAGIVRVNTARGLIGLSNRQKLAFLNTTATSTDNLLSLPAGLVRSIDAYRAILDRKNLLFRTIAAERTQVETNPSPQVAVLLQEYTAVRRQLATLTVNIPTLPDLQQYQTRIVSLSQRVEALEAELSRASATFRQTQVESTAGPSEVCAAMPVDAALIDLFWYWRYSPPAAPGTPPMFSAHYIAFILRGGACDEPMRVDLGPAAPLDEDVERFRNALSRDVPDPAVRELRARYRKELAARLHRRIFPPALLQAIAGKSRLLIAPDGALALLPFALLPGDDDHEYLLETRTISYLPSGRDVLQIAAAPPARAELLALGAPAFDLAPIQVAQATALRAGCGAQEGRFAPLLGTSAELQAIAAAYQKTYPSRPLTILEGSQATKAALLERASKAGALHLATHAYFAGEDCTPAGLASVPQRTLSESPAFLAHNPLLLAGIALAGANEREKADGILTALEVTALDLRATDLVVLSACDTGLGTPARGQELLGLRWAFAYAGAKHLVTSLWSVPDAETAALMTHFYTALWEKGLSVPAALRAAQLEMLKAARAKRDSAPNTWGAFVPSGLGD